MTKPVLLIRADGNEADAAALAALGVPSVSESYLTISAVGGESGFGTAVKLLDAVSALGATDWVVATSLNGLRYWAELAGKAKLSAALNAAESRGVRFAAIGDATAAKYAEFGIDDVLVPSVSTAAGLADALLALAPVHNGKNPKAVIPLGNLAMPTLTTALDVAGWILQAGVVYETAPVAATPDSVAGLQAHEFGAVLLRSPSAARALVEHAGAVSVPVICGGPTTAETARQLGLRVAAIANGTSPEATAQAIFEVLQGGN